MDGSNAEKATPPEADATSDEAFELGSVAGYDEGYASRDAEVAALGEVIDSSARTYEELESEHTAALQALAESRARFADSEARRAELEAVIQKAREVAQPTANGEPLRERVIEALDSAPSVVLEVRDREVAARTLEDAAQVFHDRLPDGTGNGRAYNSHTVAHMLRERAATIRKGESA